MDIDWVFVAERPRESMTFAVMVIVPVR